MTDRPSALVSAPPGSSWKTPPKDVRLSALQGMLSQPQGTVWPAVLETLKPMATSEFAITAALLTQLLRFTQTTPPIFA